MLIGYARVSTEDQTLEVQRQALSAAGCGRIYEEKISGAFRARPELDRMLEHLRAGDVVTITRLVAEDPRLPLEQRTRRRPARLVHRCG